MEEGNNSSNCRLGPSKTILMLDVDMEEFVKCMLCHVGSSVQDQGGRSIPWRC